MIHSEHLFSRHSLGLRIDSAPLRLPGALITCSGIDGSGKTTTLKLIRQYLLGKGVPCQIVPSLSTKCKALPAFQTFALDPETAVKARVDLFSLCLVCLGDRLMRLRTQIIPKLIKGTWILQDRYVYTSMAELLVSSREVEDIGALMEIIKRFPAPDLAISLDVPADEAVKRIQRRPRECNNAISQKYYEKLAISFARVATENQHLRLSTARGRDLVLDQIKPHLDRLIQARIAHCPGQKTSC